MRCIWLEKQKLSARGVPDPTPPPGEALIRMRLAGICRTDLELVRGYHPYTGVPGHEFVGEVVAARIPQGAAVSVRMNQESTRKAFPPRR